MNKHLPDMYYLQGVDGVVFKDPLSAIRWAEEQQIETPKVGTVTVVYYGSNLRCDMKTTEDLINESV